MSKRAWCGSVVVWAVAFAVALAGHGADKGAARDAQGAAGDTVDKAAADGLAAWDAWPDGQREQPDEAAPAEVGGLPPVPDRWGYYPPAAGHEEKPDQRPALRPAPRAAFPGLRARHQVRGPYPSRQVNVDAAQQNIYGDAANEPSLAVSPTDPNKIVAGWRQFDSVMSNFRQAGWAYSTNGGQTWTFPGVLEVNVFRSDPVVDVDANGNFYYASLKENFTVDVFKSLNGGVTWPTKTAAYGGDKEWMVIDRSTSSGRGFIYLSWQRNSNCCGTRVFTRSTNGGTSFSNPVTISRVPSFGTLAVGPDGELYVAGCDASTGTIDFTKFAVAKSTNARNSAQTPTFTTTLVSLGGNMAINAGPNPGGLMSQACVAVDASSGSSRGYVYLACAVGTVDDPADVMLARSTNGGTTWGAPVRVNDDAFGAWQWFAAIAVAPNGRVDAIFHDSRDDANPVSPLTSALYYAYSTNAGQTWSPNIRITPSFEHFVGWPQQNKIGDYSQIVADNAGASAIYAATFNGEQDVYFVRLGDCNHNGVHDGTDIVNGTSLDADSNGVPDECEDCNGNGIPDGTDLAGGASQDCNHNGFPDECDIAIGASADCNANGVPDECDLATGASHDCNGNGQPDECDIAQAASYDCDANGVPDECDVVDADHDCNANGVPDVCEVDGRWGLAAAYYDDPNLTGTPRGRVDAGVDFAWGTGTPAPGLQSGSFGVRWSGAVVTPAAAGVYTFSVQADNGVRLWVDGRLVVDHWVSGGVGEAAGTIALQAERTYALRLEYFHATGTAQVQLRWQPPGGEPAVIPATHLRAGRDCNGNGRLDVCELAASVDATSPTYTPLDNTPRTFTLTAPPQAVSDVTLDCHALGRINFVTTYVTVEVNGTPVGAVFDGGYQYCVLGQDTLVIPAAQYNAALAGGNAVIRLVPSPDVYAVDCGVPTFLQIRVTYTGTPVAPDCNGDGWPDACDLADGRSFDLNGNGTPDECETGFCPGDANCDRAVNWRDIDYFVAGMNDNQTGWRALFGGTAPGCPFSNLDPSGDGHVNWRDIDPLITLQNTGCR